MKYSEFEIKDHVLVKYHGMGSSLFSTQLIHVKIPEGLTEIGARAFGGCNGIESVEIPEGVKIIGKQACSTCHSLRTVRLPASLEEIRAYAFEACQNLEDINLSETVQRMGISVFPRDIELKQFPDGFIILHDILYQCLHTDKIIRIPEGVRTISYYAINFWHKSQTEQIIFPDSMEQLVAQSVNQTENLKSIIWHGIQFFLDEQIEWTEAIKYIKAVRSFLQNPEHETYQQTIKLMIEPLILYLEDSAFQKILAAGILDDQIDAYIQYAIEHQKYSRQMLLTDYKYQHCDFPEIGENLKL